MKKSGKFVQICTTTTEEVYKDVVGKGWKHSEIYKLGYVTKIGEALDKKRINELEAQNTKLQDKVSRLASRIFILEEDIVGIRKGD